MSRFDSFKHYIIANKPLLLTLLRIVIILLGLFQLITIIKFLYMLCSELINYLTNDEAYISL